MAGRERRRLVGGELFDIDDEMEEMSSAADAAAEAILVCEDTGRFILLVCW
jgi:hypothetical protein